MLNILNEVGWRLFVEKVIRTYKNIYIDINKDNKGIYNRNDSNSIHNWNGYNWNGIEEFFWTWAKLCF